MARLNLDAEVCVLGIYMTLVLAALTVLFLMAHYPLGAIALAVLTLVAFGGTVFRFHSRRMTDL